MMTPTKLPDRKPPRITLAIIGGNSTKKSQLKNANGRELGTYEFLNTKDSAWGILDTILGVEPVKLQYIQDELDKICKTLPTRSAPKSRRCFLDRLRGFF